jgi:ATP phosphoribosyltransferase
MHTLTLAVPSKGRLQEQVARYLADAGLALKQMAGARDYRAGLDGLAGVEVKLLSATEIAAALASGDIHFGITGEDLIHEAMPANGAVALLQLLGIGFANVVVAVPRAWIDVATMADLDDVCTAFHALHHRRLRIATKYVALTRGFFAAHGIGDYRIVESPGATEGAPAAGSAEAIVDITTTGATLTANDLKQLDDGSILKSQAQLAASVKARWDKKALATAEQFTARIAAREVARTSQILHLHFGKQPANILSTLQKLGCSILSQPKNKSGDYDILCPRERLMEATAALRAAAIKGAIAVRESDYVFAATNPVMDKLRAALK